MSALEDLNRYLKRLEARLRLLALSRGAAALAGAALAATALLVLAANALSFGDAAVTAARVVLFLLLAVVAGFALLIPVVRLNRRQTARRVERHNAGLEQRLLTVVEARDASDPFIQLLAADTLEALRTGDTESVAPRRRALGFAAAAGAAAVALLWLILAGPGFLGYGAALLWAGPSKGREARFYDIVVTPGDATVRRKSDQLITARLAGFENPRVRLHARYHGSTKWEDVAMQPQPESAGYQFLMTGIPEALDYYAEAGGVRSRTHTLNVKDLPAVKRIRVTYRFPHWLGRPDAVEDPGGDLRAVEGTEADLAIETDRPLPNGALTLDSGEQVPLRDGKATLPIRKDGAYHIAAIEQGQPVRLSEDYFIEAQQDSAPTVRIERPARDARVSPIEEVTLAVNATDDFGLQELAMHYSVNGGPEKTISLLSNQGAKEAKGAATLYLEDFKLAPGDIVSLYATARDARTPAKTDMYFIQAEPFERAYSQSQQMGGGQGGGEQDQNQISERQKEIIAATWNELRDNNGRAPAAENGRFLSGVQAKLRDQAQSLARRMQNRALGGANEQFQTFVRDMQQAAEDMSAAAGKLKSAEWQAALAPEQKALQHLLRAEAVFRDIQVAFGSRGGGGGGGQGNSGRDLENLFDLELDTEKNQYETGRQSAASQRDRDLDQAFEKLQQLARRQQELAQRAQPQQQTPQQRWQQEVLRREAEELARQLRASGDQDQRRAVDQLQRAIDDMRRAQSQGGAGVQRAAERLNEALGALRGSAGERAQQQMDGLARRSESLSRQQQEYVDKLRRLYDPNRTQMPDQREPQRLAEEREKSIDELQTLERELQDAVRNLAGTQRSASSKLRESLGDLQQSEIRTRMRYNTDLLRRGLGSYTVMREAPVTRGLEQLREGVRDAQQALAGGGQDPAQQRGDAARVLEQVERLRRQLEERERQSRQRAESQQQAQQQPGGQGGQQQGGQRGAGQRDGEGGNRGDVSGGASGWYNDLARLRRSLQNYRELARKIEGVAPEQLKGRLEQIELELRRKLDGDQVRSGLADAPPPGYADAVAEYFRRLSKTAR